jgi:predicted phage tail protein
MKKIFATTVLVSALLFDFINAVFNNPISQEVISLYKAEPATITAIITTIIVTAISYVLAPKPKAPRQSSFDEVKGTLVNKDSNNNPIPVVYGKRQVGIIRTFVESSGTDNQYLYVAGILCEGGGSGIQSIEEIYVDDKLVTFDGALTDGTLRGVSSSDTNFYKDSTSLISIQAFFGLDNQSASSLLDETTSWTSDHKLSGIAYLALRFKWNQDAFNGMPEVRVTLKGKKIYDPRLDTTKGGSGSHRQDTASTWAYSANSSLILLDYLRNTRYGKGLPNDAFESNYETFKTSANTCDTQVTPYTSASSINLFETNAVLDSEKKVIDNVRELLVPMRAIFNYTQGKYKIIIEGSGASQLLLTKDNVVSEVRLQGESKSEKYNRVIGTFSNPEKDYQSDTVSYPPFSDSHLALADRHSTMLTEDNETLLEKSVDMIQVTSPYQAEEICENILKRSRNNLKAEVTVTAEALNLSIGDVVTATYDTASFVAKPFRVMSLAINSDSTVTLGLEEHQDEFYDYENKLEAPAIADTTLPNPFSVAPPSAVTLSDDLIEYNDGTCITRLKVDITASPDAFVDQYEVEVKQTLDKKGNAVSDDFRVIGRGIALSYDLLNAIDGATYQVRARAINTLGVRSTFVTANRLVIGATATPSDVSSFAISLVGSNQMELSWQPVTDLDIEFYEIRYQKVASGAVWNNSTNLVQVPRRKSNSKTINILEPPFALMIKAVDKLGNESAEPATIYSNVSRLENFESIGVITE